MLLLELVTITVHCLSFVQSNQLVVFNTNGSIITYAVGPLEVRIYPRPI